MGSKCGGKILGSACKGLVRHSSNGESRQWCGITLCSHASRTFYWYPRIRVVSIGQVDLWHTFGIGGAWDGLQYSSQRSWGLDSTSTCYIEEVHQQEQFREKGKLISKWTMQFISSSRKYDIGEIRMGGIHGKQHYPILRLTMVNIRAPCFTKHCCRGKMIDIL